MNVYLDFDGTVIRHEFPRIGVHNPGWVTVIDKLQKAGHNIILNTYRANISKGSLKIAIEYINGGYAQRSISGEESLIVLQPIKDYFTKKRNPSDFDLQQSIISGELFIDDICEGTPLTDTGVVDFRALDQLFEVNGFYENTNI